MSDRGPLDQKSPRCRPGEFPLVCRFSAPPSQNLAVSFFSWHVTSERKWGTSRYPCKMPGKAHKLYGPMNPWPQKIALKPVSEDFSKQKRLIRSYLLQRFLASCLSLDCFLAVGFCSCLVECCKNNVFCKPRPRVATQDFMGVRRFGR